MAGSATKKTDPFLELEQTNHMRIEYRDCTVRVMQRVLDHCHPDQLLSISRIDNRGDISITKSDADGRGCLDKLARQSTVEPQGYIREKDMPIVLDLLECVRGMNKAWGRKLCADHLRVLADVVEDLS